MIIDTHVYSLPSRLRQPDAVLPDSETTIIQTLHRHPEGPYALSLSSIEEVSKSMDKADISKSVIVSLPWMSQDLCHENNDYILEAAAKDSRFYSICSIQPKINKWQTEAERCILSGAIGVKVNPAWQGFELDGPEMDDVASFAKSNNIFIMVHIDHPFKKSIASPAHLYNFARKNPDTKILAAHLGGLIGLYTLLPYIKKTLKNVWFDTAVSSTLQMIRFYVEAELQHKLIFGSDFPFNHSHSQKQSVDGIKALGLLPDIEKSIFSGNFSALKGSEN